MSREAHPRLTRRLDTIVKSKTAGSNPEFVALAPIAAGAHAIASAIVECVELDLQVIGAEPPSLIQFQRPCVHTRRQCPALALELRNHLAIQPEHVTRPDRHAEQYQQCR